MLPVCRPRRAVALAFAGLVLASPAVAGGWFEQNRALVWGGAITIALLLVVGLGFVALRPPRPSDPGLGGPRGTRATIDGDVSPAVLIGQSGQFRGVMVPVPSAGIELGREAPAHGRLAFAENSDVSRRHCAIRYDPGLRRFKVTDFGSSNGTFLMPDEKKLKAYEQVLCRPGQVLRLGRDNLFEMALK